ncbi:MAG: DUF6074 family protein [Beijerinckiaceae bacterium]|nr:DUF6074 family protein [Beijerinckiaceae bacterium]
MSKVVALVSSARPRQPSTKNNTDVMRVEIAPSQAKVLLIAGQFRSAEYIRTHVKYVLGLTAENGEQHVIRNLRAIERVLRQMGVEEAAITAELRIIEGAVRAELWRQVLLPECR